jgi:hypothetical protein
VILRWENRSNGWKNLLQWHFVHRKSHMGGSGSEPGPPRLQPNSKLPEPWHGLRSTQNMLKVKVVLILPSTGHEGRGESGGVIPFFLTAALDGSGWSALWPDRFASGIVDEGDGWKPKSMRTVCRREKRLKYPGKEKRAVDCPATTYTDHKTSAHRRHL